MHLSRSGLAPWEFPFCLCNLSFFLHEERTRDLQWYPFESGLGSCCFIVGNAEYLIFSLYLWHWWSRNQNHVASILFDFSLYHRSNIYIFAVKILAILIFRINFEMVWWELNKIMLDIILTTYSYARASFIPTSRLSLQSDCPSISPYSPNRSFIVCHNGIFESARGSYLRHKQSKHSTATDSLPMGYQRTYSRQWTRVSG